MSQLLGLKSLGDFLTFLREMKCRTNTGSYACATGVTESGEVASRSVIMPHPMPTDIRSNFPRTDHYFVAYHKYRTECEKREMRKGGGDKSDQNDHGDPDSGDEQENEEDNESTRAHNTGKKTVAHEKNVRAREGGMMSRTGVKPPPPRLQQPSRHQDGTAGLADPSWRRQHVLGCDREEAGTN